MGANQQPNEGSRHDHLARPDRLTVANAVTKAAGRLDILVENPSPRGEAHVTDDDNVDALDQWLTDAASELITEPFELLNFAARAMRQRSRGVIVLLTSESDKRKELAELTPVGRLQTVAELGNVIGFPASRPNPFLTGTTIKIDGGALVSAGV